MARKSRYMAYVNAMKKREEKPSSPRSVLKRLQEYKDQNVMIQVPIGGKKDGT